MATLKGTIKSLKKAEGFGFITHTATGIDHFFHRTGLFNHPNPPIPFADLREELPVEFEAEEGPKGLRAVEVRPL